MLLLLLLLFYGNFIKLLNIIAENNSSQSRSYRNHEVIFQSKTNKVFIIWISNVVQIDIRVVVKLWNATRYNFELIFNFVFISILGGGHYQIHPLKDCQMKNFECLKIFFGKLKNNLHSSNLYELNNNFWKTIAAMIIVLNCKIV